MRDQYGETERGKRKWGIYREGVLLVYHSTEEDAKCRLSQWIKDGDISGPDVERYHVAEVKKGGNCGK